MDLSLLCWLPLALGAPCQTAAHFSVQQVETNRTRMSFVQHQLKTIRKYNLTPPTRAASKLAKIQAKYSVEALPEAGDYAYLSPVTIGGQTLNLDFDTGSSDLWVYSSQTPAAAASGQKLYDTSTGSLIDGESWSITYGDGNSAQGIVYSDTITIGGLTVTGQAIEVPTSMSGNWASHNFDGLLGLAFTGINSVRPTPQYTFFDNAIAQGLPQQVFAAALRAGQPGSYDFGLIDSTKYTGDITYLPVTQSGFWEVSDPNLGDTIFDTGTSLLYLPNAITSGYYSTIPSAFNSQGMWMFSCSEQLPDFTFTIAGLQTGVRGSYINFGRVNQDTCVGGLQDREGLGARMNILGDVYLKGKYIVFDMNGGSPQIGVAQGIDG